MSDLPRIGTVVLNYKTYDYTVDCVDSLKKQSYDNHCIIIVENGSGDESLNIIQDKYGNDSQITILESKENLGFAKGNNLGIKYARERLGCDYVFVLNNDTEVPDGVFKEIIKVDCENIGAISPKFIYPNGVFYYPRENSDDIVARFKFSRMSLYRSFIFQLPIIKQIYEPYKKRKNKSKVKKYNDDNFVPKKYVLQGCGYFLTPTFFKYYTQLFPETFLYWEELNLLMYLYKVNLQTAYVKTPGIIHKFEKSTNELAKNKDVKKVKRKFYFDSCKKSKVLLDLSYEEIKRRYN